MITNPKEQIKNLIEVTLETKDDFLKVRETLTRIGVSSYKDNTLYQSCHILHKQIEGESKYFIVHFKELFGLDGKPSNMTENDTGRRNTIANLLAEWNLLKLVDAQKSADPVVAINQIKIIPFAEKNKWKLVPKYELGKYKRSEKDN